MFPLAMASLTTTGSRDSRASKISAVNVDQVIPAVTTDARKLYFCRIRRGIKASERRAFEKNNRYPYTLVLVEVHSFVSAYAYRIFAIERRYAFVSIRRDIARIRSRVHLLFRRYAAV